jgi:hypothetical protein
MTVDTNTAHRLFDRLTDDQLVDVAQHHVDKFNRAWEVVMANHYKTGRHIDAKYQMDRESELIDVIGQYISNHRPNQLHDRFVSIR